jgi:Fumarylacetoacetate (FAA) hydrolase family
MIDPRLVAALRAQLDRRRGDRVGWKLGIGDRERIGEHIAVGHLASATRLEPGGSYTPVDGEELHADAEVAVRIGPGGEIAASCAALELVDLRTPPDTPEDIVASNIFHRAVAFAPRWAPLPQGRVQARLVVNGDVRDAGRSAAAVAERLLEAEAILAAVGEALEPGDLVITGSVVQVPIEPGDQVEADLGELGAVRLQVLARS